MSPLHRHPYVHSLQLELRNRLARAPLLPAASALFIGLALCLAAVFQWGAAAFCLADEHLLTTAVLVALVSSLLAQHGHTRWRNFYRRGWLATLPVARGSRAVFILARSSFWPAVVWAGASAATGVSARLAGRHSTGVLFALGAGTLLGVITGWWLPRRDADQTGQRPTPSRAPTQHGVGFAALSGWPLLQARAWLQPRAVARLFLFALVLPLETPANIALALWALLLITVYVLLLMGATLRVAQDAASWLRPTPLSFTRYAWSVAWQPLLKQMQWLLTGLVLLAPLGLRPGAALRLAEIWLALSSVVTSTAVSCAYRGNGWRFWLLVSLAWVGIVESLRESLALPCAMVISAWQLRQAARS